MMSDTGYMEDEILEEGFAGYFKSLIKDLGEPAAAFDTQAKKFKVRAENAAARGWYEEALREYERAEKTNPKDFTVHIGIGHIYLISSNDIDKAVEYFSKAVRLTVKGEPYYFCYSSLCLAHAYELQGKVFEAVKTLEEVKSLAGKLMPFWFMGEATYRHARLCAMDSIFDEGSLAFSISIDKYYITKALGDTHLSKMKKEIEKLVDKLRRSLAAQYKNKYSTLPELLDGALKVRDYLISNSERLNNEAILKEYIRYCEKLSSFNSHIINIDNLNYFELRELDNFNFDLKVDSLKERGKAALQFIRQNYVKEFTIKQQNLIAKKKRFLTFYIDYRLNKETKNIQETLGRLRSVEALLS